MGVEELYKRHRPRNLEEVVGQRTAVKVLTRYLKDKNLPHSILLSGSSGVGKSSMAYILKEELGCIDIDFQKLNASDFRGIDNVRDIRREMMLAPMGACRIWLIEEAAGLTRASQEAFLDYLEYTPSHVYFILATTEPDKLLTTVRSRCTQIKLKSLTHRETTALLNRVAAAEKFSLGDEVIERISVISEGNARRALVCLENVSRLPTGEEQLQALERDASEASVVSLCQALLGQKTSWPEVARVLKTLGDDPERARRQVLGYMANVLLGGGKACDRASRIIAHFQCNFIDSGRAGLVRACFEALHGS